VIAANIETLRIEGAHLLCADATVVARKRPPEASPAQVVLADPPYELAGAVLKSLVTDLVNAGWLAADAHVVIERPSSDLDSPFPEGWESQARRMGDTVLWYGRVGGEVDSTSELSAEGS
jgi:16S rRNA G966 N2-methylase RsmD